MNKEIIEESTKKLILSEWLGDDKTPNLVKWGIEMGFEKGVKWKEEQDKNKYSEEEVESIWKFALYSAEQHDKFRTKNKSNFIRKDVEEFIEQYKKK
jgi:hypothetical protein